MTERVERLSEALASRSLRLALAESCTGGMLAARFTDLPGASRFFEAGLVTYSDASKQRVLGVRRETLEAHGAVSGEVAAEMLEGALRDADVAVAITGIAGPGGGSEDKPVGTVWIAGGLRTGGRVQRYHFQGDRATVREAAVDAALTLLAALVEEGS